MAKRGLSRGFLICLAVIAVLLVAGGVVFMSELEKQQARARKHIEDNEAAQRDRDAARAQFLEEP